MVAKDLKLGPHAFEAGTSLMNYLPGLLGGGYTVVNDLIISQMFCLYTNMPGFIFKSILYHMFFVLFCLFLIYPDV